MKKNGIKMSYSWGDEEELVLCSREEAWRRMCELAAEKISVSTTEGEYNMDALYNYDTCEITLHYHADDEYCYYKFVEENEVGVSTVEGEGLSLPFIYWCSSAGELSNKEGKLITEDDLPDELKRAFEELWNCGSPMYCYLVESEGKYGIVYTAEYDDETMKYFGVSSDELYNIVVNKASSLSEMESFQETKIFCGKHTGCDNCHELAVFMDWNIDKQKFNVITNILSNKVYENLFNIGDLK